MCVCVWSKNRANTEFGRRTAAFPAVKLVRIERSMHGFPLHLFHSLTRLECPLQGLCRLRVCDRSLVSEHSGGVRGVGDWGRCW